MPLPSADPADRAAGIAPAVHPQIVVPDFCNIGILFRALMGVNALVLTIVWVQAADWRTGLLDFVALSMVLEPACLWSLFALCGLRRLLVRQAPKQAHAVWAQRALCGLIPACVTAVIVHFFASTEWLTGSFAGIGEEKGALLAAFLGILLQHYFELRTRAFSPALVEARLQALQARIRPHFLFNSLNAVLSLIRNEPRRAEEALEDLADLFRVLMSDHRSMSTLDEEVRLCKQYLAIEKIRLGERLQVEWQLDALDGAFVRLAKVPVLLIQPLIENAVHYGVEPSTAPAIVRIAIFRVLDRLEVVVTNPTHGEAQPVSGNQLALANIRERLALLYDVEAQFSVTSANGSFEVKMRIPYVKASA